MAANTKIYFRWSVILVVAVLIFVFFAFYAPQFTEAALTLDMAGNKVSVQTTKVSREEVQGLDPQRHYIDSARGFFFEAPTTENWSKPNVLSGFKALIEAKGVTLSPQLLEAYERNIAINPLGPMLRQAETVRLVSGESLRVEFTDETSNELIDKIIENTIKDAESKGVQLQDEDIVSLRRSALGVETLDFANEFTVAIFDKKKLVDLPGALSLPAFFTAISSTLGINLDKLVANENQMLTGGSVSLQKVRIDGSVKDFRVYRWMLMTESKDAFYMVEIAYSPQTAGSIQVWEDLRNLMDSFRLIES